MEKLTPDTTPNSPELRRRLIAYSDCIERPAPKHSKRGIWWGLVMVVGIGIASVMLASCGGSSSSGGGILRTDTATSTAMCSRICGCAIANQIVISTECAREVEAMYSMPVGTYENALLVHEQCHVRTTNECPRDEEKMCIEIMRGALKNYPQLISDTWDAWEQHWMELPC